MIDKHTYNDSNGSWNSMNHLMLNILKTNSTRIAQNENLLMHLKVVD